MLLGVLFNSPLKPMVIPAQYKENLFLFPAHPSCILR
jgi:hypothetical protein